MRTIVVYGGRFQPVHRGHKASFDWLVNKYGAANVYMSSAEKAPGPKDPFEWNEKKQIAVAMGIPSDKFLSIKNAYVETLIRDVIPYDPENTVVITALSQKDGDRLVGKNVDAEGFALKKDGTRASMQWLPENPEPVVKGHFYVVATPTVHFSVAGNQVTGATQIREMYAQANNKQRNKIITDLYGQVNPALRKLFDNRLGNEQTESFVREFTDFLTNF
jgi:phosphopantetheine adenylyltransferase